jgi:hypothetical protein
MSQEADQCDLYRREMETFRRELPRLLLEQGRRRPRFALVYGDEVDSVWDTGGDAFQAALEKFGYGRFMIREIVPEEEPLLCFNPLVR